MAKRPTGLKYFLDRLLVTFLSVFYIAFWNLLKKPRPLDPNDRLSSYLKKKGYDKKAKQLTIAAFLPDEVAGRLETSVFRTTNVGADAVWRLGDLWTVINPLWKRSGFNVPSGRADILVQEVLGERLGIELSPNPHPEHANLLGWDAEESGQQLQALLLLKHATYVPR